MKFFFLIISLVNFNFAFSMDLSIYKAKCKEIGFKLGTEKFGECVLKLKDRDYSNTSENHQKKEAEEIRLQALKDQAEMIRIQKEMQRIKGLEKSIDLIINGIR